MKIDSIEVSHQNIPLKKVFRTAARTATEIQQVSVTITSSDGRQGKAAVGATTKVTGETTASITAAIQDFIFPQIRDLDLSDLDTVLMKIQKALPFNYSAKAAVDMAVYDLYSRCMEKPLYEHLGVFRKEITSSITISIDTIENMVSEVKNAVNQGFQSLKIKVGKDYQQDIAIVDTLYHTFGDSIRLRLDANQGWKKEQAIQAIDQFQKYPNIEFVEQPLYANDIEGMKWVKERSPLPIMADESVFHFYQAQEIIHSQAADLINIKILKCGGIYPSIQIAQMAEQAGMECMIGCMMEGPLSLFFSILLACSQRNITMFDLDSLLFLHDFELPPFIQYQCPRIAIEI